MNKIELVKAMTRAAVICQSQFLAGSCEVYLEEFKNWTPHVFSEAITKAARSSNRFPTVRQIRDARPLRSRNEWLPRIKQAIQEYGTETERQASIEAIKEVRCLIKSTGNNRSAEEKR